MTPSTGTRTDFQNEATPGLEEQHRDFTVPVRKDRQPDSNLEEEIFQRYAWAALPVVRCGKLETVTEDLWIDCPESAQHFSQTGRAKKMAAALNRCADTRKSDMGRTNPNYLAQFPLYQSKKVKDQAREVLKEAKIKADSHNSSNEQSKANSKSEADPFASLSIGALLNLAKVADSDPSRTQCMEQPC